MDLDEELETDPIEEMLSKQLQALKNYNKAREREVTERQNLLDECVALNYNSEARLKVLNQEQYSYNDKYLLAIHLNAAGKSAVDITSVIFSWNSSSYLAYSVQTLIKSKCTTNDSLRFQHDWTRTDDLRVQGDTLMLLVVEKPSFTRQLEYALTGIVNYVSEDKKEQLLLRGFTLKPADLNRSIGGFRCDTNDEIFLSMMAASQKITLFVCVGDGVNIVEALERECCYGKVRVSGEKIWFAVSDVVSEVADCLVEVENTSKNCNKLVIYFRHEDQWMEILHCMYKQIRGMSVLPKCAPIEEASLGNFKCLMLDELNHIEDFVSKAVRHELSTVNGGNFRKVLNEMEYKTDCIRGKFQN